MVGGGFVMTEQLLQPAAKISTAQHLTFSSSSVAMFSDCSTLGRGLSLLGERASVMVSALFTGFLHRRPTLLWQSSFQRSYAVSH